jgi:hypothetical protein
MSWNDVMRRVLPPVRDVDRKMDVPPHITSPFNDTNRPPGSSNPHGGVDFNYVGGSASRFNQSHPSLRSPVDGIVESAGDGKVGRIAIRDTNGFLHEILHTYSRHVAAGDPVVAGQLIGMMGNTGVKTKDGKPGNPHVHYQLKDPAGNVIDPSGYWDQRGPVDPNPAPPSYLADYQRYLGIPRSTTSNISAAPASGQSQTVDPADAAAAAEARNKVRVLGRLNPGKANLGGYDANGQATIPNQIPESNRSPTFDERFGNWVASPSVTAPLSPYQPTAPQPQADKPPGIVTGRPMPNIPLPPWVFGLPDPSEPPGDEAWSLGRLGRANWTGK